MQLSDPLTRRIHVKMSGCPNGCAQHHIANIGFYGASIKVGDRAVPAYIAHLAGNYEARRDRVRPPAQGAAAGQARAGAVERWIRFYEEERAEGEEFNAFVERVGTDPFEERVKDLAMPVDFSLETMNEFIDWSRSEPYKVERGEGECAV